MIQDFVQLVPKTLMDKSGSVFYSGRLAFEAPSELYILGANPGGDIQTQANETVSWHTNKVLQREPSDWSAYRDEPWGNFAPGTYKMQRRMRYLFSRLGVDPGKVPSSNVVFLRSNRTNELVQGFAELARLCWPFHQRVIEDLGVRVVVCLGGKSTDWVLSRVSAYRQIDEFIEKNGRGWASRTHRSDGGLTVVGLTHPSVADWTDSATDPTDLVLRAIKGKISRSKSNARHTIGVVSKSPPGRTIHEGSSLAESFIEKTGLQPGQYEMEIQGRYYQYYVHPASGGRRLKFCSVLLRQDGLVTVYANGDFDDTGGRFTRQESQSRDAFYRFDPDDDDEAWSYGARAVQQAYRSRL